MGMDYFFLARATDPQHAKAVLNSLDFQSGAVFSTMVVKGGIPICVGSGTRGNKVHRQDLLIIMRENAVKNLVDLIRDSRTHETAVINTPKGSSARQEESRANYEVEKQIRTLTSRFEENYGESVGLNPKMLPFLVRHCA